MAHGFENVDGQDDPQRWVRVLDTLRAEPAYAAYKARVIEMLRPIRGGRYLEVGMGAGTDALALMAGQGVGVTAVDSSTAMVEEARKRGLQHVVVADAHRLPFADDCFDGAWADRTFQHLDEPETAMREMVRVVRPNGRVVVADPDSSTQVVNVVDQDLAQRVLDFRTHHGLRNGSLAHQMSRLFVEAGVRETEVAAFPVASQDPAALDDALGLRTWASAARDRGLLGDDDVTRWERRLDTAIARGYFLYGFTVFVTAGST